MGLQRKSSKKDAVSVETKTRLEIILIVQNGRDMVSTMKSTPLIARISHVKSEVEFQKKKLETKKIIKTV